MIQFFFSDLTFTIAASPDQVQSHSTSATSAIPYYSTIKGVFSAKVDWMKLLATTTTSDKETVSLVITKSQVDMLAKTGDTPVDQGGNLYSMNALMLSDRKSLDHVISTPKSNGDTNVPYPLQPSLSPSYTKEEIPSSKILALPMSSGEKKKGNDTDDTSGCN